MKSNDWATNKHLISAMTKLAPMRTGGTLFVTADLLSDAQHGRIREPTFSEKRESLLDWYAFLSAADQKSKYGAHVPFNCLTDYPAAWCHSTADGNQNEWEFISRPLQKAGLIESVNNGFIRVTDKGWEQLDSKPKGRGEQGFIAMAFKPEVGDARRIIETAIISAGFRPKIIDKADYVGGVMDQIISEIRQSRFVVADMTLNRGGVYYEAGFAFGHGIPVILLCRHDHVDENSDPSMRIHFDVRHLNIITWKADELSDLQARLTNRIKALFGQGPIQEST